MYLSINRPFIPSALGKRGVGPLGAVPFPPPPNPRRLVRSSARGLRGLGDCSPNDTACVMREFEASVARNAALETANNRIYRANCQRDPNRTAESCERQYPDVSAEALWQGRDPMTPPSMSGGPMPYAPTTGYISPAIYTAPEKIPGYPIGGPTAGPPPPSPPAGAALGVVIENLSRPGQTSAFKVGDNWRLTVRGPANTAVTGSSVQNGKPNAASAFGSTDSSGQKVLTGQMSADTVGSWLENWMVGGQSAGSLSFNVAAASDGGSTTAGGSGGGGSTNTTSGGSAGGAVDLSFLTQPVFGIPAWMAGVVGLGALVILPGLLGGRR